MGALPLPFARNLTGHKLIEYWGGIRQLKIKQYFLAEL